MPTSITLPRPLSVAFVVAMSLAPPSSAQGKVPLPTDKTVTLRDDHAEYYVEGTQRIASNVKIENLRQMRIVGRGEDPTIEVDGTFDMRAVTGGYVRIEGVKIVLLPRCRRLVLLNTELTNGSQVISSDEDPIEPTIILQDYKLERGTRFELYLDGGKVVLMNGLSRVPIVLHGVDRSAKKGSNLEVVAIGIRGRDKGLLGGLEVNGGKQVLVRNVDLAGSLTRFDRIDRLTFDGNNARSRRTEFLHDKPGRLTRATIKNTDFRSKEVAFIAPSKQRGKPEKLFVESSWFHAGDEEDEIRAATIIDCDDFEPDEDGSGVLVRLRKIKPAPLGFGG